MASLESEKESSSVSGKKVVAASVEKQNGRQEEVRRIQKNGERELISEAKSVDDAIIFGHYIDDNGKNVTNSNKNSMEQDLSVDASLRYQAQSYEVAFDYCQTLDTSRGKFMCYMAGPHFSSNENKNENKNKNCDELIIVCLHGAGHCALSWSALCQLMNKDNNIFAFDYRGHGHTNVSESKIDCNEYSMSKDTLVNDIICVLNTKFSKENGYMTPPPYLLVGHSLGGALAVHCAHQSNELPSIVGIVVIDVVEGTALNSLIHMKNIINRRPKSFDSMTSAIRYMVTSGIIRNAKSAVISVPPMFKKKDENNKSKYVWRTDVLKSSPYWKEWFLGLSNLFLTAKATKMLMLADTDRLDKELTIGQMQGKYQLAVMGGGVGHTVHEDSPQRVAEKITAFIARNQFEKLWKINKKFAFKK